MKTILSITLILIHFSFIAQICEGEKVVLIEDGKCSNMPWKLVFEDNFNGNTLNLEKWDIPYQGVIRDYEHENEKQWYSNTGNSPQIPFENNIEVSEGTLKIIARFEETPIYGEYTNWSENPPKSYSSNFKYTSAELDSKNKFKYGKYEIRCKIPKGKGFWPAFWMYGESDNGVNNEIDVFEFWENDTKDHNMTIHYNGTMCHSDYNGPDYSKAFHTFTLIWDEYKIEWYVDGELKRRSTKFYSLLGQQLDCNSLKAFHPYIFNSSFPNEKMNIIVNLAIENKLDFKPDEKTTFPGIFEIDYIRFYEK